MDEIEAVDTRPSPHDLSHLSRLATRHQGQHRTVVVGRRPRRNVGAGRGCCDGQHAEQHKQQPQTDDGAGEVLQTAVIQSLRASTKLQAAQLQQATAQLQFMRDVQRRQDELGRAVSYSLLAHPGARAGPAATFAQGDANEDSSHTSAELRSLCSKVERMHQEIARISTMASQHGSDQSVVLGGSMSLPPLDAYFERARTRSAAAAAAAGPGPEREGAAVAVGAPSIDDVAHAASVLERVQESKRNLDHGDLSSSRRSRRRFNLDNVVESIVRGGVNARNSADGNGSGVMIDEDEDALFQERQQMRRHVDRMIQLMSERNRRTNITQLLAEIGIHAAPGGPSGVGGGDLPPKSRTRAPVASHRVKASFTRRSVPEPPVATTRASQMRRAAPPATTRTVAPKVPKPVSKPMQGRQQQQQQQQQPKPPQRHQAQLGPRSYPQHAGKWAPPPSSVVDDDGDAPSAVVAPPPARLAAAASPKRLPPRSAGASALPRYSAPPWRAAPRVRAGDEVPRDDVDKGTTSATLHSPRGAPTRVAEVPEDDDEVVMPSAGPSMSAVVLEGPSSPHASRDPSNRDGRVVGAPVVPASSIYGADGAVQPESAESGATFEEARVRYVMGKLTALLERELVETLTDEMLPLVPGHGYDRHAVASSSSSSSPSPSTGRTTPEPAVEPTRRVVNDAATATSPPPVGRAVADASTMVDTVPQVVSTEASTAMSPPPVPVARLWSDAGTAMSPEPPPPSLPSRPHSPPRPHDPLDALRAAVGTANITELLLALAGERAGASADRRPSPPPPPPPVSTRSIAIETTLPAVVSVATSPPPPAIESPPQPPRVQPSPVRVRTPREEEPPPSPDQFDAAAFSDSTLGAADPDASEGEILLSTDGEWVGETDGDDHNERGGAVGRRASPLEFVSGRRRKVVGGTHAGAGADDDETLSDGQLDPTATAMLRGRVSWHGVTLSSTTTDSDSSQAGGSSRWDDTGAFPD